MGETPLHIHTYDIEMTDARKKGLPTTDKVGKQGLPSTPTLSEGKRRDFFCVGGKGESEQR